MLLAHPPQSDQRDLRVVTSDAVHLCGIVVPSTATTRAGERPITFVVAHGFTNTVAYPPFLRLVGWLQRFGAVRALDFRGHGRSGGASSVGGDPEVADVDAAVAAARADGADAVVTLGLSMGGGVALRQAALGRHRPDAVICVSAVSRWYVRDTPPMRRVHWLLETTAGRVLGSRAVRLRLDEPWRTLPLSPLQVVHRIAPTPLLLVHGDRDHYFPVEHPEALYAAANEPKELWLVEGFGHAENAASPELLERIGAHLPVLLARGDG